MLNDNFSAIAYLRNLRGPRAVQTIRQWNMVQVRLLVLAAASWGYAVGISCPGEACCCYQLLSSLCSGLGWQSVSFRNFFARIVCLKRIAFCENIAICPSHEPVKKVKLWYLRTLRNSLTRKNDMCSKISNYPLSWHTPQDFYIDRLSSEKFMSISMSIQVHGHVNINVHICAACLRPCCMSMSLLHRYMYLPSACWC